MKSRQSQRRSFDQILIDVRAENIRHLLNKAVAAARLAKALKGESKERVNHLKAEILDFTRKHFPKDLHGLGQSGWFAQD